MRRDLAASFLIDQLLVFNGAPGSFFESAIGGERIGAARSQSSITLPAVAGATSFIVVDGSAAVNFTLSVF